MKKKLTFLIGILFISAQAQNKHFDLVWNDTPTQFSTEDSSIKLPTFTKEYFVYNDDATISFVAQWNDDRSVNKNSIRIENVAYGTLSNENLGGIDKRKLPTTIKSEILNSSARGKNAHVLVVSPLINENGVVKKVLSFDVSYNFLARRPNSIFKSSEAITNSVLASGNFYRFSVQESGIFRIDANFLNQIGINTGNLNPRKLKIYGNGGRMIPHLNSLKLKNIITKKNLKESPNISGNVKWSNPEAMKLSQEAVNKAAKEIGKAQNRAVSIFTSDLKNNKYDKMDLSKAISTGNIRDASNSKREVLSRLYYDVRERFNKYNRRKK